MVCPCPSKVPLKVWMFKAVPIGVHCLKFEPSPFNSPFAPKTPSFKTMSFASVMVLPSKVLPPFTNCAKPASCSGVVISNEDSESLYQVTSAVPSQTSCIPSYISRTIPNILPPRRERANHHPQENEKPGQRANRSPPGLLLIPYYII